MKIAEVNNASTVALTSPYGLGGVRPQPAVDDLTDVDVSSIADGDVLVWDAGSSMWVAGPVPPPTPTSLWVPVMVEDGSTGLWYVTVTGDGDAVMTEVPL